MSASLQTLWLEKVPWTHFSGSRLLQLALVDDLKQQAPCRHRSTMKQQLSAHIWPFGLLT
jgi:hypothetical protein